MTQTGKTFRVFVSSTFSDLKEERNALQRYVFPRLTDLAKIHGCRFQAIDLRWGISEEAGLDQRTMQICLNELARCQKTTPRPNFIVLLGDRYGWEPLPEEIPETEFDEIRKAVDSDREATGLNALDLLDKWYRLDLNAVPPVYVLQPRTGPFEDYATWEQEAERPLRYIFRDAVKGLKLRDEALLKYDASATHQEIERGAMQVEDAGNHVFGFFRRITNLDVLAANLPDTAAKDFVDSDIQDRFDKTAHEKLKILKDKLSTKIGQGNVYKYDAHWTGQDVTTEHIGTLPETVEACETLINEDYFPRNMCEAVWRELAGLIKAEVEKIEAKDPLVQENEAHAEFRKDRAKVFIGREDILNEIDRYIGDNRRQPLAIYGASGTGKSALMSKAVQNLRDRKKDSSTQEALIIERFIGATPESTNIRSLLEGLCKFINRAYAQEEFEVPEDFNKLVQAFEDRMTLATSEKPLLVFLDALDQLSQAESAHNLNWLSSELPPNVKIIVSTLPEPYPCLNTLKAKLPPENVRELKLLSPQQGEEALEVWLITAGRTLQEVQRREVLEKFSQCGLPLYLKLGFEEAKRWHSYDDVPEYEGRPGLAKDISGIIGNLFWRLSLPVNHGNLLVERSLGYLAASKNGLTEDEMLDVLSRDNEFYTQFRGQTFHELTEERLPVIIWSRLYFDLEPYLTERSADGTSLVSFYHRQLSEIVTDTFLVGETRQKQHRQLARYFNGQKHKIESGDKKIPNLRKLSELPYQQTQGEMWNDIEVTLTDLLFIEAKCAAGMTYDLITDYNAAMDALPENKEEKRKEKEREERITKYTEDVIAYAKAWNTARECHAKDAEKYPMPKPEVPLPEIIPSIEPWSEEKIRGNIERIINNPTRLDRIRIFYQFVNSESHAMIKFASHPGFCIQHAYNSANSGPVASTAETLVNHEVNNIFLLQLSTQRPEYNPHPALLRVLGGLKQSITSVSVTPDCRRAISGSWDNTIRVWNLGTSICLYTLMEHTSTVNSVSITPDGHYAASGSLDNTVRVWDLTTGVCLHIFDEHTDSVTAVAITPDGRFVISGSDDRTIKVWDLRNRVCVNTLKSYPIKKKTFQDTCSEMMLEAMKPEARTEILDEAKMFRNPTHDIKSLDITLYGDLAVSGSGYGIIRVWDLRKGKCINTFEIDGYDIRTVAIASGGRRIVTVGFMEQQEKDEGLLRIWDVVTGECVGTIEYDRHLPETGSLAITHDCSRALTGSGDGAIHLWDLESGMRLRTLRGHTANVTSVAITPDAHYALSGSEDETIRIWDLENGESTNPPEGHRCITITPNGKLAITGNRDGTVYVWDICTGQCIKSLRGHTDGVISVTCTMDGRYVLSGSDDGTVRMWNMETGMGETTLDEGEGVLKNIFSVYVTADACRAVTASHASIRVWDLKTTQCIQELRGHTSIINMLVLTPDNRYAITGSGGRDNTLRVWDLSTGRCLNVLQIHTLEANCVEILPDGKRCAVSGWNLSGPKDFEDEIRIWDIQSGIQLWTLKAGVSSVTCMSISHDGKYILSGRRDGVIQIWDIKARTSIKTLEGHDAWITALCITEDDSLVVSSSRDGTIRVWRLDTGVLIAIHKTSGGSVKFLETKFSRIVAGTENGSLYFVKLRNVSVPDKAPLTTAKRVWRFGDKGKHQGYDKELTAICPWCGSHFAIQSKKRESPFKILIKILSRTDVRYLPSVKVELGSELACPVPSCGKVIKLNKL